MRQFPRVSTDQNNIGVCLGNACRDSTNANFGNQLYRNACCRIHVLQVENQLCQIFDRINIVVRRRRNKTDTRNGMPNSCDDFIDLVPGS